MQSTVQSVLNMKELRSALSKGLEVLCQNTFINKPAFNKGLIKVLVAKNLFLLHTDVCVELENKNSSLCLISLAASPSPPGQSQVPAQQSRVEGREGLANFAVD